MYRYRLYIALIVLFLVSLSSCMKTFTLKEKDMKLEGGSIAVISGLNNEANLSMAILVTEELHKNSRFKVLSQKDIAGALPYYPVRIQGPWTRAYVKIDEDYTRTDVEKIKKMQKRLGVKYVYVLWMPASISWGGSGSDVDELHAISQLFMFPGGKEIGNGEFVMRLFTGGIVIGQTANSKKELMEQFAKKISTDIVAQMNMQK